MRLLKTVILTATAGIFVVSTALAQNQGVPRSGGWVPREAVKPDPSKLRVPRGYEAEVFVSGLDTPSAAAVDGQGNVWVAISGNLFGPFEYESAGQRIKNPVSGPHVKVFDQSGKLLDQWSNLIMPWGMSITENDDVWVCGSSPHWWYRHGKYPEIKDQPVLADGQVRFCGEAVLALVGERATIERIRDQDLPLSYSPLPALATLA